MIKEHYSPRGGHWFTIVAPNNKVLATSEMYKTKQAMLKGIAAVKKVFNAK